MVRRAERSVWAAVEAYGTEPGESRGQGGVNPVTATYLNRLSDLLFVLARCANLPGGDVLWQPGGGREQAPGDAGAAAAQATLTLKPGGLDSSQARTAV